MWKKLLVLLIVPALLLGMTLAERTDEAAEATRDRMAAHAYTMMHVWNPLTFGYGRTLNITGWQIVPTGEPNAVELQVQVTFSKDSDDDLIMGITKQMFAVEDMVTQEIFWPVRLELERGGVRQEVAGPLLVGEDQPVDAVFSFALRDDQLSLALVYTALVIGEDGALNIGKNVSCMMISRTLMDCAFVNNTEKDVTGVFIVPAGSRTWGQSLLLPYVNPVVRAGGGKTMLRFGNTAYAKRSGETWTVNVVFADNEHVSFHSYRMDQAVCLMLSTDESAAGGYALTMQE